MAAAAPAGTFMAEVPEGALPGSAFNAVAPTGVVVPVIVPAGAVAGTLLAIPTPQAMTLTTTEPQAPIRYTTKVRVNTKTVDGMRAFAVMHIVFGHLFLFSDMPSLFFPKAEHVPIPRSWPADKKCPDGWFMHDGGDTCYFGSCSPKKWEAAGEDCAQAAVGARLASFASAAKQAEALGAFYGPGEVWIGLSERDRKGAWTWADTDGRAPAFDAWAPGEPNDWGGHSEECVFSVQTSGGRWRWYDAHCDTPSMYICEVNARTSCGADGCSHADVAKSACAATGQEVCMMGMVALMGGGSMGFFYIISGFVMVVGYAQLTLRPGATCKETVCGPVTDKIFCACCSSGAGEEDVQDLPVLNTRAFLRKRFARLAPMYFLTNALGAATGVAMGWVKVATMWQWLVVVTTATGTSSWILALPFKNELTWTVSTMMFFYLCFPALAPRIQRIPPRHLRAVALLMYGIQIGVMIVGSILVSIFVDPERGGWVRAFPLARLPIFIMGMCCGMQRLHAEHARQECKPPPSEMCPVIPCVAGLGCFHPVTGLAIYWVAMTTLFSSATFACSSVIGMRLLLEVLFPILFYDWIYAATDPEQITSPIARFFQSRVMVFLGDISMCTYMIHMLVMQWLINIPLGVEFGRAPPWAVFSVAPASVGLGWLLTRFFETPMANLIRPEPRKTAHAEDPTCAPEPALVGSPCTTTTTGTTTPTVTIA